MCSYPLRRNCDEKVSDSRCRCSVIVVVYRAGAAAQAATITVPNSNFQFESDGVTSIPSGTGTYQKGNADTSQVKNGAATYDILGWTFGTGDNNSGVFNSSGTYGAFSESGDTMQQILPVSSGTVKVGDTYTLITSVSGTFNSLGLTMSVYAYNTATQGANAHSLGQHGPGSQRHDGGLPGERDRAGGHLRATASHPTRLQWHHRQQRLSEPRQRAANGYARAGVGVRLRLGRPWPAGPAPTSGITPLIARLKTEETRGRERGRSQSAGRAAASHNYLRPRLADVAVSTDSIYGSPAGRILRG